MKLAKELSGLTFAAVLLFAHAAASQPNSMGHQRLESYRTKSLDERKIVKTVIDYQESYNSYDAAGVLAVHLPGAMIKAGATGDCSERLVTKEEYVGMVADTLATSKMYNFKLIFLIPKSLSVEGSHATSIVPFILYSIAQDYWEKGIFSFEFRKTDAGWLISRNTWKILDLSYNP